MPTCHPVPTCHRASRRPDAPAKLASAPAADQILQSGLGQPLPGQQIAQPDELPAFLPRRQEARLLLPVNSLDLAQAQAQTILALTSALQVRPVDTRTRVRRGGSTAGQHTPSANPDQPPPTATGLLPYFETLLQVPKRGKSTENPNTVTRAVSAQSNYVPIRAVNHQATETNR